MPLFLRRQQLLQCRTGRRPARSGRGRLQVRLREFGVDGCRKSGEPRLVHREGRDQDGDDADRGDPPGDVPHQPVAPILEAFHRRASSLGGLPRWLRIVR